MAEVRQTVALDIHGLTASLRTDWPEIGEALRRDFAWFASAPADAPTLEVDVAEGEPDYDEFAAARAVLLTERNAVFRHGDRTVIDYGGRALAVLGADGRTLRVRGTDGWVVRRAAFDYLLARAGEHLDQIGLPRVHGLGLAGAGHGVVVMLPMGGGKTTLAVAAIAAGAGLLSESSPLLDRRGNLHPLPLPLWVRTTSPEAASLPVEHVRDLPGLDPDPAVLEIGAFAELIPRRPVPLRHLVLGSRGLERRPVIERLPRTAAVAPLLRDSVAGFGFYQGIEFLLRNGVRGVATTSAYAARRAAHCRTALSHATVWRLTLGRDRAANWDALARLLD